MFKKSTKAFENERKIERRSFPPVREQRSLSSSARLQKNSEHTRTKFIYQWTSFFVTKANSNKDFVVILLIYAL